MSRATVSKSRADKTKEKEKDRGGSTLVPAPPVNTDVIPGRFTETDWGSLLDKEDGEDFVVEIVSDVVNAALHIIYNNYIQRQLYPYTVTQARDAILQVIEWQFLARDDGEQKPEEDFTWQEEEEPEPCFPDAWAQGSVPKRPQPPLSPPVSEPDTEMTSISPIDDPEILDDMPASVNETGTIVTEETIQEGDDTERPEEVKETTDLGTGEEAVTVEDRTTRMLTPKVASPVKPSSRPPKYKPHRGPLRSAGLRGITKTLDETDTEHQLAEHRALNPAATPDGTDTFLGHMPSSCHSILKVQSGRPPGSKDVTYDDKGNVVSVIRLDPERLPAHRVRTKYTIVDPAVEAAHARLVAMRTGRYISANGTDRRDVRMGGISSGTTSQVVRASQAAKSGQAMAGAAAAASSNTMTLNMRAAFESSAVNGAITPLPPPLIESMELSPGVVVKEGNRVKRGPKLQPRHGEAVTSAKLRSLRPVGHDSQRRQQQQLTVEHILSSRSPTLRPLHTNEPIPPIGPLPVQQSAV